MRFFPIHTARPPALTGALLLFTLLICSAPALADGVPMMLPDSPAPLVIDTAGGEKTFSIEVADDPVERERGLMFRRSMGDDHGMLFVFPGEGEIAFWMKNTPMPLDMVFIDGDGEIQAIKRGEPFSTANVSPAAPVQFVLELKAGTAGKAGIEAGDKVHHPAIDGPDPKPAN